MFNSKLLVYQRVTENELFDKLSNIGRDHTVSTNLSQGTSSIPFPRAIIFPPKWENLLQTLRVQRGKSGGYHLLRVGATLQNMGEMIGFDSSPLEF